MPDKHALATLAAALRKLDKAHTLLMSVPASRGLAAEVETTMRRLRDIVAGGDGNVDSDDDDRLTARDIEEFSGYLRSCTNAQVLGVLDKERAAERNGYAALAEAEAERRGLEFERRESES